jgi:hypothetical protein
MVQVNLLWCRKCGCLHKPEQHVEKVSAPAVISEEPIAAVPEPKQVLQAIRAGRPSGYGEGPKLPDGRFDRKAYQREYMRAYMRKRRELERKE